MTDKRLKALTTFLQQHQLANAEIVPIAGDASFRRYFRLHQHDMRFIVMDAPPEKEDTEPFIHIANYLRRHDLSAPEIIEKDVEKGFLLLEDLGDDSFSSLLQKHPEKESALYHGAIDVLIHLSRLDLPKKTPNYDTDLLLKECRLLTDWFITYFVDTPPLPEEAEEAYIALWKGLCNIAKIDQNVLVLRDYHADNLMWLPQRRGVQTIGLLDFQDAVIGSPIYDIISLLEDARRDVDPNVVQHVTNYYIHQRQRVNREDFMAAYAILAAQRNCKIIGIFARLAARDGKQRYLDFLPRVWHNLHHDLSHPVLTPLKTWIDRYIPEESRSNITLRKPLEQTHARKR